jgi:hypothetical protein
MNIAMKKMKFRSLCFAVFFSVLATAAFADDDPGPDPGGDPDAPIDGGVALLVAAGIAYGAKKINDKKKEDVIL